MNKEAEFLKNYNVKDFEQLSMTADIVLISVSDEKSTNYRKTDKKKMSILLIKRDNYPYKDKWCLPGGFLDVNNETLEECAKRVLKVETGLLNIYLEQLYTFDNINRDPRCRVISTSYMSLVDKSRLNKLTKNASWFDVIYINEDKENVEVILNNGVDTINLKLKRKIISNTNNTYKYFDFEKDKVLAFDHSEIILTAINRLKNKVDYTDIVFHMMPKYFTLGELQDVYEVILGKELLIPAFRRVIKNKVKKTDKIKKGGGHRPSAMFTYKKDV